MTKLNLKGFEATALGSLPFKDVKTALSLIKETIPLIPHWPQLPTRGIQEHFVFQNLNYLIELGILKIEGEKLLVDYEDDNWNENLVKFYELYLEVESGDISNISLIEPPEDSAPGYYEFVKWMEEGLFPEAIAYKGHIPGPLSVGLFIKDHKGKLIYYNNHIRDIMVKTLMLSGLNQALRLKSTGKTPIIFVDDPAIGAYGTPNYITLDRQTMINDLAFIAQGIRNGGGIVGAHACAGVDWAMFMEAGFDIISFDTGYFQSVTAYKNEFIKFVDRGGILAWGIVPTYNLSDDENLENLKRQLETQINYFIEKGIDKEKLFKQIILTPACGTGVLTEEQAKRIYYLIKSLSELYLEK